MDGVVDASGIITRGGSRLDVGPSPLVCLFFSIYVGFPEWFEELIHAQLRADRPRVPPVRTLTRLDRREPDQRGLRRGPYRRRLYRPLLLQRRDLHHRPPGCHGLEG